MALVWTQWHFSITFKLSNNLHYVNNTCEKVHMVIDLIKMIFLLRKAQRSSDLVSLGIDVVNYTFGSSYFYHVPHLEGEEVFGSTKWPDDCPPSANNDSHHPHCVNFFSSMNNNSCCSTQCCWECNNRLMVPMLVPLWYLEVTKNWKKVVTHPQIPWKTQT